MEAQIIAHTPMRRMTWSSAYDSTAMGDKHQNEHGKTHIHVKNARLLPCDRLRLQSRKAISK